MLATNILNSKVQNQDLCLLSTVTPLPHSQVLPIVFCFPRHPDLKVLSLHGFLLLPHSFYRLSSKSGRLCFLLSLTFILLFPYLLPCSPGHHLFKPTPCRGRLSVSHLSVHPMPPALTFPALQTIHLLAKAPSSMSLLLPLAQVFHA